jgi:hypothetical protein
VITSLRNLYCVKLIKPLLMEAWLQMEDMLFDYNLIVHPYVLLEHPRLNDIFTIVVQKLSRELT